MGNLTGKAVLVTGSTRGIGRAVAETLLRSGAVVGVHGRTQAAAETACADLCADPSRTVALSADFADPESAAGIVRLFASAAGGIDGLVNNAGGGKVFTFRGVTLDNWRRTFAVNLEAAVCACRESYMIMRARKSGRIVNIASLVAHGPGKWMGADYAASKAGLVSLTKSLAFEAAAYGIRVNAVSPGFVNTGMTAVLNEQIRARLRIPMNRFAEPSEVAAAVSFLLSDESNFITGEVLHVDGGLWM